MGKVKTTGKSANQALATALAKKGTNTVRAFESQVKTWYKNHAKRLLSLTGGDEKAVGQIMSGLMYSVSTNPQLLRCSFDSIVDCLMQSAALKLVPGAMQECYYVPFKNKATFVIDYRGLIKLAYNSGIISSINCAIVYEGDVFDYELGTNTYLKHIPTLDEEEKGEMIAAWCIIKMVSGQEVITVMNKASIDKIRNRSQAANSSYSAWHTDYEPMALKTVIKQALKKVPKSPEMAKAIQIDNQIERPDLASKKVVEIEDFKIEEFTQEEKEKPTQKETIQQPKGDHQNELQKLPTSESPNEHRDNS